ncbi:MAG: GtrA family protein [Bacteroidia bacterium]|nr:GtrA family protein [Bacteroidia bacterium]
MKEYFCHALSNVQFWRYVAVGGVGTVWDIGFYTLIRSFGIAHWPALSLSFGSGTLIGFFLTRYWVFRIETGPWKGQFLRFWMVIGLVYILNGLLMEGLYLLLPIGRWQGFMARTLAAAAILPVSFTLHRRVSFM